MTKNLKLSLIFIALPAACLMAGCASAPKEGPMVFTGQALAATDTTKTKLSGPAEQAAIARFEAFSGNISAANITNNIRNVYAPNVYFIDPFKQIHGRAGLEAYLLRDSALVSQYKINWKDVAESKGDYYFRWVMAVKLKRDGKNKPASLTCGISQIRFGTDGRVVFEQDYFDAAAFLYERLPILGGEIRFVKKHL